MRPEPRVVDWRLTKQNAIHQNIARIPDYVGFRHYASIPSRGPESWENRAFYRGEKQLSAQARGLQSRILCRTMCIQLNMLRRKLGQDYDHHMRCQDYIIPGNTLNSMVRCMAKLKELKDHRYGRHRVSFWQNLLLVKRPLWTSVGSSTTFPSPGQGYMASTSDVSRKPKRYICMKLTLPVPAAQLHLF